MFRNLAILLGLTVLEHFNPLLGNSLCFSIKPALLISSIISIFQPPPGEFSMFQYYERGNIYVKPAISTPSWGILYVSSFLPSPSLSRTYGGDFNPLLGNSLCFTTAHGDGDAPSKTISTPSWGILYVSQARAILYYRLIKGNFNPLLGNSLCF